MLPPAPGLFSTTTGCPSACCSLGAMRRAERSTGPPGAYGTTRWTGRDGQSCAFKQALAPSASAAKAALAFFDEHLFALLADRRHGDDHQQDHRAMMKPALIGLVTKVLGSPRESSIARLRFSSISGPRMKPRIIGAG